jgi:O-antigen/teichoic acid export membrane protein
MATIARGGAIGLVGAVVSAVAGFGLVLAVTRGLTPDDAGAFFTLTSLFLLMSSASSLGVDVGLGRFMLRYVAHGRSADLPSLLRAAFRPVLVVTAVVGLATFLLADPVAELSGLDDHGRDALRLLILALPAAVLTDCALAGTRAFGRMRATVLVDKIGRSVAQPVLVLGAAALGLGLLGATLGWAVPYAAAPVAATHPCRQVFNTRTDQSGTSDQLAEYAAVRAEFWSFTWARGVARLAQMAIQRADIIIVAALRSPTEAAIYTAATRFVVIGQFGSQAIQQVLQPRFTALLADDDHATLGSVYRTSTAWSIAVSWPLYLVVGCAPAVYLSLFGEEYRDRGVTVVVVMMLAMLFSVAAGPADTLLLMHGRSGLSLVNSLVALAVDLGLCFVLVPTMGIAGAAVAWAAAVAVRCLLAVVQLRRFLQITSLSPAVVTAGAANLLCFAAPIVALSVGGVLGPLTLVLTAVLAALVYLGMLWWARETLMLPALGALLQRKAPARG